MSKLLCTVGSMTERLLTAPGVREADSIGAELLAVVVVIGMIGFIIWLVNK